MKQLRSVTEESSGAFESMRSYKGKVFELDAHMNRLEASLNALGFKGNFNKDSVARLVGRGLKENRLRDAYIRVAVSRQAAELIIKKPASYPKEHYKNGISLKTSTIKKNIQSSLSPQVKSSNFLGGILAKIDSSDAFEQVLLDKDGFVAECTTSNIFIVKGKIVITPPLYLGVLGGITRALVMRMAKKIGLIMKEVPFTRHELYNADEVFITNTSMGIMPVVRVDGRVIGNGKVGRTTNKLRDCFARLCRARNDKGRKP